VTLSPRQRRLRLGVNIDHVATIRNARGGDHPDPVRAAILAAEAGADGITAHLREDRRHITDQDIDRLMGQIGLPLNLEMAATEEMLEIALAHRPHAACIVPERREERTTEGGLDVRAQRPRIQDACARLAAAGIRVSLFIDADPAQIEAAAACGAPCIEIHTGHYADLPAGEQRDAEYKRIVQAVETGVRCGLTVHAGHGLNYQNVLPIAALDAVRELNIGHAIVARALFTGLQAAVREMKTLMLRARGLAG